MNTIDTIYQRRSVKHYDPEFEIPQGDIQKILGCAVQSPTAFNIQHWRLLIVKDPELRKEIKKAAWNQAQVTDSSLLIIICADTKAWEKDPEKYWKNAPPEVQTFMKEAIISYYTDKPQAQRDEALRSCGIAAQTIMLAAKELGYDSCPMDGFDFDEVGKLIKLPQDYLISMFVVIGKATQEASPKGGQLPISEVVSYDKFENI